MLKPALMIHRITESIFDLPLERFDLTFDDGTEDHFEYFPRFLAIPTRKIYFITCSWIGQTGFLTVDQLRSMAQHPDVEIGAHSHAHTLLNEYPLDEKIRIMQADTAAVCEWFLRELGWQPRAFCFPNNNAIYGIYTQIAKQHGFTEFYGSERIDPYWLHLPEWQRHNHLW